MDEIEKVLLLQTNRIYQISKRVYPLLPYLLIVVTIPFLYFYTYHSLYRINRNLFLNEQAEYHLDSDRVLPNIVYYITSIFVIMALFVLYYYIDKGKIPKDLFPIPTKSLYFFFLPLLLLILTVVGFFLYQKRIIRFADAGDMRRGIVASIAFIYIFVLLLYFFQNDKIEWNMAILYVAGLMITIFILYFLSFVSLANSLTIQMRNDKFDILSKICLLGSRGSIEKEPYVVSAASKKGCDCKNESFSCFLGDGDEMIENFESSSLKAKEEIPEEEKLRDITYTEEEGEKADIFGEDLKYKSGVPIKYYNNNLQKFDDLLLRDFQYFGSYYSYLASSPENGSPNLQSLQSVVRDFQCRFLHLDIYSSLPDEINSSIAVPVVRCEKMASGAEAIPFNEALKTIAKYAWPQNENSPPLFLYLSFHVENNKKIYQKTFQLLQQYFGTYLIDKMYGFNERDHLFPVAELPIENAMGKVIILSDIYPTYSILDEIIHCNVRDGKGSIRIKEYKNEYIRYDQKGILLDYNKSDLILDNRRNINFYYTLPNPDFAGDATAQSKAGLFNLNLNDILKYGAQGPLSYPFIPDHNMQLILKYFSQFKIPMVLKPPFLRQIAKKEVAAPKSVSADLTEPTETKASMGELMEYNISFT